MFDGNILRAFITLTILVGLFGLLFWLIKKYTTKSRRNSAGVNLEVISKLSLQPKNHIFVIKAAEKTLLLGVSEKNINLISDLSDSVQKTPSFDSVLKQTQKPQIPQNYEGNKQLINADDSSLSFRTFLLSTLGKSN